MANGKHTINYAYSVELKILKNQKPNIRTKELYKNSFIIDHDTDLAPHAK